MSVLPEELEVVALLIEELGEAAQAAGKVLRHGWASVDPTKPPSKQIPNDEALARECGDILAALWILDQLGHLDMTDVECAARDKLGRIGKWLHHLDNINAALDVLPRLKARTP